MWGMKLIAYQETPLVITNQPNSQTVTVGDPVTLSVGVSGGPARYQWQKNAVNLANATNAAFSIPNVALSSSGEYRGIVTNLVSTVTSSVAKVATLSHNDALE